MLCGPKKDRSQRPVLSTAKKILKKEKNGEKKIK